MASQRVHGRQELLQWINDLLESDYVRIEDLSDGA